MRATLKDGKTYIVGGMTFRQGIPLTVSEALGAYLASTGHFEVAPEEPEGGARGAPSGRPAPASVGQPAAPRGPAGAPTAPAAATEGERTTDAQSAERPLGSPEGNARHAPGGARRGRGRPRKREGSV